MIRPTTNVAVQTAFWEDVFMCLQIPHTSENPSNDEHSHKRNGHPSRRWLVSELEKIKEKNSELNKELEFQKALNRSLSATKDQKEREIASLRSQNNAGAHENKVLCEMNKQLSQDIFIMKNIVVKLNFELERYQDKLRSIENTTELNIDSMVESPHVSGPQIQPKKEWIDGEITIIAPLLIAYEETLKEKDDLIAEFKVNIEKLCGKMKAVVKENAELRAKIAESEKQGEVNYADWIAVQREMTLILEQNQLLVRQAKLSQSKIKDLKTSFQIKLDQVCSERDDALSDFAAFRADYYTLKGRNSALEEENKRLKIEAEEKVPKSVHATHVAECRRILDELKKKYTEEGIKLINRIAQLEEEEKSNKNCLISAVEKLRLTETKLKDSEEKRLTCAEEKTILLKKISDLEAREEYYKQYSSPSTAEKLKETEAKLKDLEDKRLAGEKIELELKERIGDFLKFSTELFSEHECVLKEYNVEMRLNELLFSKFKKIKKLLENVKLESQKKIQKLNEKLSSLLKKKKRLRDQMDQEITQLKKDLNEKDVQIRELKKITKIRERELALVWQAAITERDGN